MAQKIFFLLFLALAIISLIGIFATDNPNAVILFLISTCMTLLIGCFAGDEDDEEITYKNIKR